MENSIDHIITRILSGNSSSEDFLSLSEWLNADEKNKKEFRLLMSYWDAEVSFSHSLMPNVSLDNLRRSKQAKEIEADPFHRYSHCGGNRLSCSVFRDNTLKYPGS